jgi:hypothetical protein
MKHLTRFIMLGLVVVFVLGGCAQEPTQEIAAAQAAIQAAIQAGASTYTPDEIKSLGDELTAAINMANDKTGKFLASNKKAKENLIKIKTDAEALATTVLSKKTEAKNSATISLTDAKVALQEAKTLLVSAPKGKGTKADIEAFNADLSALEASLPEIQTTIDGEDYLGAAGKALSIKEKALGISGQIKQAIEKVNAAKKGK